MSFTSGSLEMGLVVRPHELESQRSQGIEVVLADQ
jgi:hypothetical protein